MSISFIVAVLASTLGVALFFMLDDIYRSLQAKWRGRQYIKFLEEFEEDFWDEDE